MLESFFKQCCRPKANNFIKKEILTQVFSCEYCKNFMNTYFEEHLRTAASAGVLLEFCNDTYTYEQKQLYILKYKKIVVLVTVEIQGLH